MYNYNDIKEIHLEITSKCQARCPMCPRRLQGGPMNPFVKLDEINLETFKSWFPKPFLKQLERFFMCGNLGDPIVAQDTLEIFKYLRTHNPNIQLSMHTNGSARTKEWWNALADVNVKVTFGIDGLYDTHHLYRIDTDFNKIIENSKAFINAGGDATWTMLIFKHNEHQVDECRRMSKQLGFSKFVEKHTSRFNDNKFAIIDDAGVPLYYIEPTNKSEEITENVQKSIITKSKTISCKAQTYKQIYVAASGNVSPCCWLDFEWYTPFNEHRMDYMEKIGKFPNLQENTLEEIFSNGFFKEIENTWSCSPLKECSKQCGKFDKLGAQFES